MQAPFYIKQVHLFIGAVTYCCDMWPWKSYILAPLADLSGKGTFIGLWFIRKHLMSSKLAWSRMFFFDIWITLSQVIFALVHLIISLVLLLYNKIYQGLIILAKFSSTELNYTTIEKEIILVVETFRIFLLILLGADIHAYTNHKTLTHD